MAQHDQVIDNGPGRAVRLDMNAALAALFSSNSGPVEPQTIVGGQLWFDTNDPAKPRFWIRNPANTIWMDVGQDFAYSQYIAAPGDYNVTKDNLGDFIQFANISVASLPDVTTLDNKFWFEISAQNGAVTITPASGDTIDGGPTLVVPTGFTVEVRATGSDWRTSMVPVTLAKVQTVLAQLPVVTPLATDQLMLVDATTGAPRGRASKELFGNPPGTFLDFGGPSPPSGYLVRNGAAVSRTTYAALFAAIGTWWGAGDGSTTFNLPDSRGVVTRGWDNGRGLDPSRTFGSYQADMFASHAHSVYDPSHAHGTSGSSGTGSEAYFAYQNSAIRSLNTNASGTGISIYAAGGAETRMKNVAALPIIKF